MERDVDFIEGWNNIKEILDSLDLDIVKSATNNLAAGARVRKGLRTIKAQAAALVKQSMKYDKEIREARRVAKEESVQLAE